MSVVRRGSLDRRLRRIESAHGAVEQACAVCGQSRDGRLPPGARIRVTMGDDDAGLPTSDFCTACGQRVVIRVEFDHGG